MEERLISLAQELIRIPSPSGQEQQAALAIERTMKELGFDEVVIDRYGSVIGRIRGRYPGPTVLLDGHIDHVDVIDAAEWLHDPFGAEIEENRIYGRAASDMKGSVAAMIIAAAEFNRSTGGAFGGSVCVAGTVHEECFEGVAAREVSRVLRPDLVIIGEATSGTLKIGQRGRAEVIVEAEGQSCHSSNPEKGINAAYHMVSAIQALRGLTPPSHPILGKGILELTDLISFPYPGASVVPSRCRATFDRRTLPGEDPEAILSPIRKILETVKQQIPELKATVRLEQGQAPCWTGETIAAQRYFPAWLMEEDSELVRKCRKGLRQVGIDAPLSHFSFCTNGSHYCGEAGIPTVGFGPSLESLAHVRDEYIEIRELVTACRGFIGILSELLACPKEEPEQ